MSIRFIPNDPLAGASAPGIRTQARHPDRPAARASFTLSNVQPESAQPPGTPGFLFWQCREAGLAALEAWEGCAGPLASWQGNRKRLPLLQDVDVDLNAFYDRSSFSFFHQAVGNKTFFSGASTDVVAHEVGHGLLDAIRPELWDAAFLEAGAFHEAFGDCVAILTALNDRDTRKKLLAATATLGKKNFVEATAEELSDGIRRLDPNHNAAAPRHALNAFQFQIPETLPSDGGPGALIDEVHSFGMLFSGCFYDLIALLFAAQSAKTEATLLKASRTAGALLVEGARTALIKPRFFQSVGRAMVLADAAANGGANRDAIKAAFQKHNILLGANAMLAPTAVLAGAAPRLGRAPSLGAATRKDLAARLQVKPGTRLKVESAGFADQSFAQVVHTRTVAVGGLDKRLKGASIAVDIPVLIGKSGPKAAVMGSVPEPVATEQEATAFVKSLLAHGQIEFTGAAGSKAAALAAGKKAKGATKAKPISRETHRVAVVGGKKVLVRVRFHCGR